MFKKDDYYVYIMASTSGTLYIGVTEDLERRVKEHKRLSHEGFTKKYHCVKLIYYEYFKYILNAIAREKELKGWRRSKKEALIKSSNPRWEDLAEGSFVARLSSG